MPLDRPGHPEKEVPGVNYDADPRWRNKPIVPSQILVYDIRLERWSREREPLLEVIDRFPTSTLVPETAPVTPSAGLVRAAEAATNPIEKQRFQYLEEQFGWIRYLRLEQYQTHEYDSALSGKCRWLHCASKFSEYLRGFLWALSEDAATISATLRMLDDTVQRQTRFSKHGKYFAPFSKVLRPNSTDVASDPYPMLICVPFLDWSILGATPPLRFQVDRREGFRSAKSSAHLLRSILQYYYRLEDTADREGSQVFAKHKPWSTDRELDLKVRQWYGHYPTALNVDELWILAVDAQHVATFSSNQTWKSRWPPLQLTTRISDVSFRGIRNAYFRSDQNAEYTAMTHAVISLSGAVGMLHRNFWQDIVLPATDRYAAWLSHLQYRLQRAPSTKLVMDLIACQEELNIVISITQHQLEMINDLQASFVPLQDGDRDRLSSSPVSQRRPSISNNYGEFNTRPVDAAQHRATYRQLSSSTLADPVAQLLDNLQRELVDLQDLRDNTDRLVTRTIQLVNIRLEDHGKAILVFTVVTIVFLPLNFVSSFFGMNFADIRRMRQTQWLFWAVALCVTTAVVAASLFLAFSGGAILEKLVMWRDRRKEQHLSTATVLRQSSPAPSGSSFKVLGTDRQERFNPYP